MNSLRVFTIGGVMSYRALFHWQSPTFYIPTMLGHPLFKTVSEGKDRVGQTEIHRPGSFRPGRTG